MGYHILARNWRSGRGELDIVACWEHILIFIEVKTRRERVSLDFAPLDGVTGEKQRRIAKLSHRFIQAHAIELQRRRLRHIRYDIIGVIYRGRFTSPRIHHYQDAFAPTIAISPRHTR